MACLSVNITCVKSTESVVAAVAIATVGLTAVATSRASTVAWLVADVSCLKQPLAVMGIVAARVMEVKISGIRSDDVPVPSESAHNGNATVHITPVASAALSVTPCQRASISCQKSEIGNSVISAIAVPFHVRLQTQQPSAVSITGIDCLVAIISEVCAIGGGELYVLAAADGTLRTRDGGFFLLDPAREGEE